MKLHSSSIAHLAPGSSVYTIDIPKKGVVAGGRVVNMYLDRVTSLKSITFDYEQRKATIEFISPLDYQSSFVTEVIMDDNE